MKTSPSTRTKWIRFLAPILLPALLICAYSQVAAGQQLSADKGSDGSRSARALLAKLIPDLPPQPFDDANPEYIKMRREYLSRFFGAGPGGVSPAAFQRTLRAVRDLPKSPLLRGQTFVSTQTSAAGKSFPPWAFPIAPPITSTGYGDSGAMVTALGPDPTNNDVIYTGSFGGLAKSVDASAGNNSHWQYLSDEWDSQEISSISVDPNAPNHVYVGTGRDYLPFAVGLYRSFDGGASWESVGKNEFGATYVRVIAVDPNASGSEEETTLYAINGFSNTAGLWRSGKSGSDGTWTLLRQGPPSSLYFGTFDFAIDPSPPTSVLYVADGDGVSRSVDSGRNWDLIYPANGNWIYVASRIRLCVVDSVVYLQAPSAANLVNRLWKLGRDNNWVEIPTLCPPGAEACNGNINPDLFTVDPADPSIILTGTATLFRTENEGATWTQIGLPGVGELHCDERAMAFTPDRSGVVYSGNDGGVSRSESHAQAGTWVNLNQNLPGALLYSIGLSRDGSMVAGTQDNGFAFSFQGAPWNSVVAGDSGFDLINPDPADGNTMYFETVWSYFTFTRIRMPSNGPQEWTRIRPEILDPELSSGRCNYNPAFSLSPTHPQHLITACQHLCQSRDEGTTWTTVGGPLASGGAWSDSVSKASEAPSDPNVIYAITQNYGRVWVTERADSGTAAPWADITGSLPGGIVSIAIHPTDPEIVYVGLMSGVYKTVNGLNPDPGSVTWQLLSAPPNALYRDLAIDLDNPNHVFAASHAGVFATVDGGLTWEYASAGIPTGMAVTALSFNRVTRHLAASTYGRGAFVMTLPPAVYITTPANGATVSGSVAVSATTSSNVLGVQFKLDNDILENEDTSPPFSITWNTTSVPPGGHTLTAIARDTAGLTETSDPVVVTVDNAAPTVGIVTPFNGSSVSGTVTVAALAADDVGVVGVQFKLDGFILGDEDLSPPYSTSWNTILLLGTHTLTAVARDAAGHTTTSAPITVTVDNVAPTVGIITPSNGSSVSGTVTVVALAGDNVGVVGVQFKLDGFILGDEDMSPPYSTSWNTILLVGTHTLTAVARDAAGHTTTSAPITVTVDNVAPTVSITSPANGVNVSGEITISATASDNVGVIGVDFKVDGSSIGGEDTTAPYLINWKTTTVPNGYYTLTAVARDAALHTTTSAGVTVKVSNRGH